MRRLTLICLIGLAIVATTFVPARAEAVAAAAGPTLDYHLSFSEDDHPTVEVHVSGASAPKTVLTFTGSMLNGLADPVSAVFPVDGVVAADGRSLSWRYRGNDLEVDNGSASEFTVTYRPDMTRLGSPMGDRWQAFAMFRRQVVFFVAETVFPVFDGEPAAITVGFTLPGRTKVFSSLDEEQPGLFVCRPDLFGNLRYDFPKAYFTGGEPFFSVTHETAWGDKYVYVWFSRDVANQHWLPSWETTPWEEAERYMSLYEQFAAYFRDIIGPLPTHTVVFTDVRHVPDMDLLVNLDWYHYVQIWPRDSKDDVAHHALHAYDFWPSQTKMAFSPDSPGPSGYLREGLNVYYEQVASAEVLGDDKRPGKTLALLALDQRGARFNVRANQMHMTYNASGLKVYLLDQYIREVTGDAKSLDDFVRAIWDSVKDNTSPHTLTDGEITAAFAQVVGQAKAGHLDDLVRLETFDRSSFASLNPAFQAYVDWLAGSYFWGKPALWCAFMDIAAAKGAEWPHYVNSPHVLDLYRQPALQPFQDYLAGLRKQQFSEEDIVAALGAATGKDHAGFFEFWNDFGVPIAPADFAPLSAWDPSEATESGFMSVWRPVGTLGTEHYLSGVRQRAEIVLDKSAPQATLGVQVGLWSFAGYASLDEAKAALSGSGVSFTRTLQHEMRGVYYTWAYFQVSTDDPARRTFAFDLTLPSFASHPSFEVFDANGGMNAWGGGVYSLHPVPPVAFPLSLTAGEMALVDTELEGETYTVSLGQASVEARPGQVVTATGATGQTVRVELYDRFGLLRGVKELPLGSGGAGSGGSSSTGGAGGGAVPGLSVAGTPVAAEDDFAGPGLQFRVGERVMLVNGSPREIDAAAVMLNGRMMLPVRYVADPLGATIEWDQATAKTTLRLGETVVEMWVGRNTAKINEQDTPIDPGNPAVCPVNLGGRVMLPLRFVAEALGCSVGYYGGTAVIFQRP